MYTVAQRLDRKGGNQVVAAMSPIDDLISRTPSPRLSLVAREPSYVKLPIPEPRGNVPSITVEVSVIELGRIEIRDSKECYFTLQNQTDDLLECEITTGPVSKAVFRKFEGLVRLKPRESRILYTSFTPTSIGRNSAVISVRDSASYESDNESIVTFKWYGVLHSYIRFISIEQELDLGYCYVDAKSKYSKVKPFHLENISGHDLFISVVSNLTLQCFIFADSSLSIPISDRLFPRDSCITVYVALQPHLSQQGKPGNDSSRDCRTLV